VLEYRLLVLKKSRSTEQEGLGRDRDQIGLTAKYAAATLGKLADGLQVER
jgi:hypothetical protein